MIRKCAGAAAPCGSILQGVPRIARRRPFDLHGCWVVRTGAMVDRSVSEGLAVGMMDRDWYRERFARRVIGIQGPIDDPTGEPARIRRGIAKPRPQLPPGAQSGAFWAWAVLALLGLIAAGVLASWLR